MASAISSSSACGSRSQAMAKALAVERLMPAQQCTTIGARRPSRGANASTRSTIAASGATSRPSACAMSCTPSRRWRSAAKPAGVSISSSGLQQRDDVRGRALGDHLGKPAQRA